jgi:phage tail-like protein
VEEYQEGGVNDRVHRFPSRFTFPSIVLKRGVTTDETLYRWHEEFLEGGGVRRDGLVILTDAAREPIKIWSFERGLPVKWTGPALDAQSSAVAIEELEIAHEKLTLVRAAGE